jgi:hypothetical protein
MPRLCYDRGKSTRYPLDRRLGGDKGPSGPSEEEKILDPTGTGTPTPQSPSRCTDYTKPAPYFNGSVQTVTVECVALLFRIREVPTSSFDPRGLLSLTGVSYNVPKSLNHISL